MRHEPTCMLRCGPIHRGTCTNPRFNPPTGRTPPGIKTGVEFLCTGNSARKRNVRFCVTSRRLIRLRHLLPEAHEDWVNVL